jgi:hypothetical protein
VPADERARWQAGRSEGDGFEGDDARVKEDG